MKPIQSLGLSGMALLITIGVPATAVADSTDAVDGGATAGTTVQAAAPPVEEQLSRTARLVAAAEAAPVVPDPKAITTLTDARAAAATTGTKPIRKGTILVTPDAFKNLIPTGHAAMVWSSSQVVESVAGGVVMGKNNWETSKKKAYGLTVKSTTVAQDAKAAEWAKDKVGKPYNLAYWNIDTRSKFYCSQLVWAAFKDNFQVDLNTSAYSYWGLERRCSSTGICVTVPKKYNPIHPMELVDTDKTSVIWKMG
ncbi:MAG: YiiX/YebB-like N1pC/P60 family cysteine hydrolase [Propionicimonas sp.]